MLFPALTLSGQGCREDYFICLRGVAVIVDQNCWHLGFTHHGTHGLLAFEEQDPRCFSPTVRSSVSSSTNGLVQDPRQPPLLGLCI